MRYHGSHHSIDYTATLGFFEAQGRDALDGAPQTATMFQGRELAARRDAVERDTVIPLLALRGDECVLDIGCGYGRWAQMLKGRIDRYLGIDFSKELLRLAEAQAIAGCVFQQLAAQDVSMGKLRMAGPFNLIICSGILIYLNDADVARLASAIAALAAPRAQVYLREPMALQARLTLDRYPSEELRREYSAIYRTPGDCHRLFGAPIKERGFVLTREQSLYPRELCNRVETEQQIQLWKRSE